MSRSVSAPSSVTNTSPCWNGLIVPGSTFRYGSNFCAVTVIPRAFSSRPREAATIPLPSAETTPPVTNTNLATGSHRTRPPGQSASSTSKRALVGVCGATEPGDEEEEQDRQKPQNDARHQIGTTRSAVAGRGVRLQRHISAAMSGMEAG